MTQSGYYTYANWIPMLDELSLPQLYDLAGIGQQMAFVKRIPPAWRLVTIDASVNVEGNAKIFNKLCTVTISTTGHVLIVSEWQPELDTETTKKFAAEADRVYGELARSVHVHISSHRLEFLRVARKEPEMPVFEDVREELADNYSMEMFKQQQQFEKERSLYIKAADGVSREILDSKKALFSASGNYISKVLQLLEQRVRLGKLKETIQSWSAAEAFYSRFYECNPRYRGSSKRYERTTDVIRATDSVIEEYAELVGSYMLQSSSLWLAIIAIIAGIVGVLIGVVPDGIHVAWRVVIAAAGICIGYAVVYYVAVRRIARRFQLATDTLIKAGEVGRKRGQEE